MKNLVKKFQKSVSIFLLLFSFLLTACNSVVIKENSSDDPRHQYFNETINGVKLYYHIFTADPQKPYVFFLHGGPGGNSAGPEGYFTYLTDNKVNWVFMDQRGSGRSANFKLDPSKSEMKLEQLTIDLMVKDIEEIRKKHNLGKIIIYGYSWGGILAAQYTYSYPESLLGYIIASSPHNWKNDSENLLKRLTHYIKEINLVLEDWMKNGYTDKLFYNLPQLTVFFDSQGNNDLIEIIYKKDVINSSLKNRIEKIIAENKTIESKLIDLSKVEYSIKKTMDILQWNYHFTQQGNLSTPGVIIKSSKKNSSVNQNGDVLMGLIKGKLMDNSWYYPQFKVPGFFWCGVNDIWNPEAMISASKLAPNSSYFVFPRSGHDFTHSEPLLFVSKLLEAIDSFNETKKVETITSNISKQLWPKLVGKFINSSFGEITISIVEEKLVGNLAGMQINFEPVSDSEFIMRGGAGNGRKLVFEADANGQYNKFNGGGYVFERVHAEKNETIDRSLWQAFIGSYQNSRIGECKVYVEGDNLMGTFAGSIFKFLPISNKEFTMEGGPGNGSKAVFKLEENGKCNSFSAKGLDFNRVN